LAPKQKIGTNKAKAKKSLFNKAPAHKQIGQMDCSDSSTDEETEVQYAESSEDEWPTDIEIIEPVLG